MRQTPNKGFNLIDSNDNINVEVINQNFEKLDSVKSIAGNGIVRCAKYEFIKTKTAEGSLQIPLSEIIIPDNLSMFGWFCTVAVTYRDDVWYKFRSPFLISDSLSIPRYISSYTDSACYISFTTINPDLYVVGNSSTVFDDEYLKINIRDGIIRIIGIANKHTIPESYPHTINLYVFGINNE